jgi:hypothetical protein
MAQAPNPHAGGVQQAASYQELYASVPDVLDGQYTTYLALFSSKSGEEPMMLWDHVITSTNDVPKVFVMLQVPSVISIHHLTRYALLLSLLGAQPWDD